MKKKRVLFDQIIKKYNSLITELSPLEISIILAMSNFKDWATRREIFESSRKIDETTSKPWFTSQLTSMEKYLKLLEEKDYIDSDWLITPRSKSKGVKRFILKFNYKKYSYIRTLISQFKIILSNKMNIPLNQIEFCDKYLDNSYYAAESFRQFKQQTLKKDKKEYQKKINKQSLTFATEHISLLHLTIDTLKKDKESLKRIKNQIINELKYIDKLEVGIKN